MRFTPSTRKAITNMWLNDNMSFRGIASCYTTTEEVVEKLVRQQLREDQPEVKVEKFLKK